MTEWKEYKLGEIASFKTGKLNSNAAVENGIYPFFTCSPITYAINEYAYNQKAILLAGNNAEGNFSVKYYEGKFNAYQRTYIIESNKGICDLKFLYYSLKLCLQEFKHISQGTSTKFLTSVILNNFSISLPPLPEQISIASILSSLDDKIDLLHRENKTLEAMAETLFRQWFIEEAKEDWEEIPFGEVIEIFDSKRKPLSKMERDKMKNGTIFYPYYGAAEIMDYIDSYLFDGEFILMGEDGTVKTDDGYPILQYVSGKFWPNNHAHVLKAKPPYNNCFIWNYLKTTNIEYIVTGAVQPKINQANLLSLPFYKYPDDLLEEYKSVTQNVWEKTMNNNKQIQTLIQQRDALLPKLMSGEVKI